MKSASIVATTIVLNLAILFAGPATAQNRSGRGEAVTANQLVAEADARTARIKADLRLTSDQETNWAPFESALHDISKSRADRQMTLRADRANQKEPEDIIAFLNRQAAFLADRSADEKKLADAAQGLYVSLDDRQKRRLANELIRMTRE
jgi:hypothetical protein